MARLVAEGASPGTPAAVIASGTRPEQRTVAGTVSTIAGLAAEAGIRPQAITLAGEVAALHDRLLLVRAAAAVRRRGGRRARAPVAWQPGWAGWLRTCWRRRRSRFDCLPGADLGRYRDRLPDVRQRVERLPP